MRSLFILSASGALCFCLAIGWLQSEHTRADSSTTVAAERTGQSAEHTAGSSVGKLDSPQHNVEQDDFVVHEWGTFTSFSGSDGMKLEFRPLVDSDLPPFVLNRARQSGVLNPLSKTQYLAFQRMETPVLYFYTDREREVNVRVGFPQGLITEFYPPVAGMRPEFKWEHVERNGDAIVAEKIGDSMVDWGTVRLIPTNGVQVDIEDPALAKRVEQRVLDSLIPPTGEQHYAYARETDAALVHVYRAPNGDGLSNLFGPPTGDFFEKFLFYRGVGNFSLPLHLAAQDDGVFRLTNSGPEEVRSLFLVTVEPAAGREGLAASGDEIRWSQTDRIGPRQSLTLTQSPRPGSLADLTEAVVASLVDEGLYEKESRAMVKTWEASWFGEAGTRLFYIVPHRTTEELLPLRIEPRPRELVRVLVGRMEIMTPGEEQRILDMVGRSRDARTSARMREASDEELRAALEPILDELLALGRLAEPALVRARHVAPEPALRSEASSLLAELRKRHEASTWGQALTLP